jgi:hypothetical protein
LPGSAIPNAALFSTNNSEVVAILMDTTNYPSGAATANNGHVKNPQQTKFLNAQPVSDTVSPGVGTDLVYRDPWGNPYIISLDLNYDDQCQDAFYSRALVSSSTGVNGGSGLNGLVEPSGGVDQYLFHGKIMVWSAGPDGKIDPNLPASGPNAGVNKDNVVSWQ